MTRRTDRVAEAIRRLMSEIMQKGLKDPRLAGFITIIKVEVTPDLKLAKIYYSVLESDKKKKLVKEGLESAKAYIRRIIGDELKLRYVPEIFFIVDKSSEYKARIDKILDKIRKERENDHLI